MKIATAVSTIFTLSLLTVFSVQSGDYSYTGDKDVAKNVIVEPSELELTFIMPGWLSGLEGSIGFAPEIVTNLDVGVDKILKNLDMIFAASVEGRKNKLGFILDGLYVEASVGGETPGPIFSDINVSVTQALVDGVLTYRLFEGERAWLEVIGGARYNYMENQIDYTRNIPGPPVRITRRDVNSWVDPFVGIRGKYELTEKSYVVARGDIGGFGISSELTWNLFGALGYEINERTAMEIGYRYLYTDYSQGGFVYDMAMKGIYAGFRVDF